MKHLPALPLCLALTFAACGNTPDNAEKASETLADSAATRYYMLRATGNYAEYADAMLSCDGMPADYKARIIAMLKQHNQTLLKEKKGVSRVQVAKTEMHDNGQMANVFLNVTYKDSSHEEIIFPLVLENGRWRIQ